MYGAVWEMKFYIKIPRSTLAKTSIVAAVCLYILVLLLVTHAKTGDSAHAKEVTSGMAMSTLLNMGLLSVAPIAYLPRILVR